ncbi:uncharacterized protein [Kogia breviceps]|uniref:uncharacterized protein n=1 Tax=Kogia breviceps TaxID=27615 RepID=UPI0034D23EEF
MPARPCVCRLSVGLGARQEAGALGASFLGRTCPVPASSTQPASHQPCDPWRSSQRVSVNPGHALLPGASWTTGRTSGVPVARTAVVVPAEPRRAHGGPGEPAAAGWAGVGGLGAGLSDAADAAALWTTFAGAGLRNPGQLSPEGRRQEPCLHARLPSLHAHVRCLGWVVAAVRGHVPHLTQHQRPPFPRGALPHRSPSQPGRGAAPWDPQALSAFSLKQDLRGHLKCLQTTRQLLSVSPGAGGFAGRGLQPGPSLLLPHQQAHRPALTRRFSPVSVSHAWSEGAAEAQQSPLSPPSPPVLWAWPRPRVTTAPPRPTFPPSLHLESRFAGLAAVPHGW